MITFEDACALTADIAGIPFTILENFRQCEDFCRKNQFHSRQDYLEPYVLEVMLDEMDSTEIVCTNDVFQIHYIFCRVEKQALVVGPYCTESFGENDYRVLLRRKNLSALNFQDLNAYRGKIPVMKEHDILHLLRCIAKNCNWSVVPNQIRRVDFEGMVKTPEEDQVRLPYSQEVMERYREEDALMEAIRQGDHVSAIAHWRELHNHMAGFKRVLGAPLETARSSAAITRSMIRLAAKDAGIPPLVNDEISGKSAAIIREATTIDEIDHEHERVIREYCRAIRGQKKSGYSGMTQSVQYYLENHYQKEISADAIARELEISPGYMSAKFRDEVGMTPNQYLQNLRLQKAAALLTRSKESVQQISNAVGIPDANYFARIFKQSFGVTPSQYRRTPR